MDRVYTFERLLLSRAKSECASACSKEVKILYSGHFSLIWQVLFPSEELYLYCLSVAESKKTVATCDRRGFPIIQGTSSLSSHWMQQTSTFWQFPLTNEFKSSLEAGNKFFVVKKSGKIRKRLSTQVGGGRAFAEKKKCLFFFAVRVQTTGNLGCAAAAGRWFLAATSFWFCCMATLGRLLLSIVVTLS